MARKKSSNGTAASAVTDTKTQPLPFKEIRRESPPRAFVSGVQSTVKGLTGVVQTLALKTLIVGPNASQKTALINSVEVALTGAVSDVKGRALSRDAKQLRRLGSAEGFSSTVEINGGDLKAPVYSKFRLTNEKGEKTGVLELPPGMTAEQSERVFPMRALREAILGDDDAMRRFFLKHVCGEITVEDITSRVPEPMKVRFAQVYKASDVSPVDALLAAGKLAAKNARGAGGRVKAQTEMLKVQAAGMAPEPTEATLKELEAVVAGSQVALIAATANPQAEMSRLANEAQAVLQRQQEITNWLQTVPAAPTGLHEVVNLLRAISPPVGSPVTGINCPCCGANTDTSTLEARRIYAEQMAAMHTQRSQAENEIIRLQGEYSRLHVQYEMHAARPQSSLTVEQANAALIETETALINAKALKKQYEQLRAGQGVKVKADEDKKAWKALEQEIDGIIAALVFGSRDAFVQRVQKYLPEGDTFGLELVADGEFIAEFGLFDPNRKELNTALGGAEWTRVSLAIAAAISEGSTLTILVPEDRGWEPFTLAKTLQALPDFPGQVLFPSPIPPAFVPEGWQVVRTGDYPEPWGASRGNTVAARPA